MISCSWHRSRQPRPDCRERPRGPRHCPAGASPPPETWLSRQRARLVLLWRALWPSGDDARGVIFASVRRRALRNRIGGNAEERAAHEIDTLRYQDWIGRFDALKPRDREAIKSHIEAADFPVPLVLMIFDAATARFAAGAVEHLRQQLLSRFEALFAFTSDCPMEAVASARHAAKGDPRFSFSRAPFSESDASARATRPCSPRRRRRAVARACALYVSRRRERTRCALSPLRR